MDSSEHVQKENHMLYLVITPIIIKTVKIDAMKKDENILYFIDSFQWVRAPVSILIILESCNLNLTGYTN